ncbi:MAG: cytochrome P450 [Pseudonocardia sp.]
MLGNLLREHGDETSDVELAGLADGVLTGGHETTASMLALGALVLLEDPSLAADVRSGDVPVTSLVEELLRHLSVVQVAFPRFARTALSLGNQKIDIGDVVLCSLSGANRGPAFGMDPERVDPRRRPATHVAFGHGVHRCLGAKLGRMELRTALPTLRRRFPGLRLADAPDELEFRTISLVHGVRSLPVAW